MDKNLRKPLADHEIESLDDFLWMVYQDYDGLSLEAADGLFCALAVNPEIPPPSEWLQIILGETFEFDSDKEAEAITSLLFRHWNRVNHLIQTRPKSGDTDTFYCPLIFDQDDESEDGKFGEQWAKGFLIGINYCPDAWEKTMQKNEDIAQLLTPIILLDLGYDPDKGDEVMTYEKRKELFKFLPVAAYAFHDYWKDSRHKTSPSRKKAKIGRNDPCPCGSGKKYKKCCYGKVSDTIH